MNKPAPAADAVRSFGCGRDQTLVLLASGKLMGWGGEGSGRPAPAAPEYCSTPLANGSAVEVDLRQPLVAVTAGYGVSLGITAGNEVTDQELATAGGLKRTVVFRAVNNPNFGQAQFKLPITEAPANQVVHPGDELHDWIFNALNAKGEPNTLSETVLGVGTPSASGPPSSLIEIIPFQSRRAKKQTVALGSVEEWTIYNMNNVRHPFHIHVNPCWVVKVSDQPDLQPYWADTIALPPGSPEKPGFVTFRSRFFDFKGAYVLHCHMLAHEDMGMMQVVEVV